MGVPVAGVGVHVYVLLLLILIYLRRRRQLVLLLLLLPIEIGRRKTINHQRPDRGHHGDKPSEGEILPRLFAEARRRQVLEGVGQDVDEPRGEYHAGGEGLDDEEEVPVRAEGWDPLAEDGDADADETPDEDGENGGDLEVLGRGLVVAVAGRGHVGGAVTVGESLREKEEEEEKKKEGEGERFHGC